MINRKAVLKERPDGNLDESKMQIVEEEVGELPDGHVRLQVEHLSIDAFIRTTLDPKAFHGTVDLNAPITALGTARVIESKFDGLNQGDAVFGPLGAQTVAQLPGEMYRKLDDAEFPARTWLGAMGMTTGLTAYAGMVHVGEVAEGDTVVVSAAAGAVGSMASQIARIKGASRVIGIAGGAHKCEYLINELGCTHAIDYKADDVDARLREYAPDGINVYFDNVGGEILDFVLDQLVAGSRVVICGAISQYDDLSDVRGPKLYLRLAERNSSMRGFTVDRYMEHFPQMEADIAGWMKSGELKMPEHIEKGIENFPKALMMLQNGGHMGKLLVEI